MNLQTIKNQYDNRMVTLELTEDAVIECLRKPIVCPNKDSIPQWKFCSVKGDIRCNDNMGWTNILTLDYDDADYSFSEFEDRFRGYKYFLHTSYSYDGTNSKFRVLLFLDQEYEIDRMFCRTSQAIYSPYTLLAQYFDHVDKASFVKAQFFKVPAIKDESSPYHYSIHDGELFSLSEIDTFLFAYNECKNFLENERREMEVKSRVMAAQRGGDLTGAYEYVKRHIEDAEPGERHNTVFGLGAFYKRCGGDFGSFSSIRPNWADKNYDNQMRRLEREWFKL